MSYDRTLIQIRERNFLDILDLSLVVIRRWPVRIGLASAAGVLPFASLNLWLFYGNPDLSVGWWGPLLALEAPWATAFLTLVLGGLLFGEHPRPSKLAHRFLSALPAMFLNQFVIRGMLLGSIAFSPLIPARLAFLDEIILLERAGGFRPLRRCYKLCARLEGDLLGRTLALFFFSSVFILCFTIGSESLGAILIQGEKGWYDGGDNAAVLDLRAQFAIWLTVAFSGIVRFLTYVDQRIRLEGWAVELTLREAAIALEKSHP